MEPELPPPPVPVTVTKHAVSPRSIVVLLLTFSFTAASGFLGYTYWHMRSKLATSSQQPSPPQSEAMQQSQEPPDETENWKTYTNSQYGYNIQYPESLEMMSDPNSENKEFTFKLPEGESIHGTIFEGAADSNNDNEYRKTFVLSKNEYLLMTYVQCDGQNCGFGKINMPLFSQILSTFQFLPED